MEMEARGRVLQIIRISLSTIHCSDTDIDHVRPENMWNTSGGLMTRSCEPAEK